jgi:hypothetical protein
MKPDNFPGDFIADLSAAIDKVKACGEVPNQVQVNPALLTPEMLPYFIAECQRLKIAFTITSHTGEKISWP